MQSSLLMFHKPKGFVTTRSDELGRKTVYDLLPAWAMTDSWMPVGRLDADSKGLLLFSQGGKDVDALTRPGGLNKTYELVIRGRLTPETRDLVLKGVSSPVGVLKAKSLEILGNAGPKTRVKVVLDEGKNRHLRRLFGALKDPKIGTPLKVLELKRTAIGGLLLDVPSGKWRFLTPAERKGLLGGSIPGFHRGKALETE